MYTYWPKHPLLFIKTLVFKILKHTSIISSRIIDLITSHAEKATM